MCARSRASIAPATATPNPPRPTMHADQPAEHVAAELVAQRRGSLGRRARASGRARGCARPTAPRSWWRGSGAPRPGRGSGCRRARARRWRPRRGAAAGRTAGCPCCAPRPRGARGRRGARGASSERGSRPESSGPTLRRGPPNERRIASRRRSMPRSPTSASWRAVATMSMRRLGTSRTMRTRAVERAGRRVVHVVEPQEDGALAADALEHAANDQPAQLGLVEREPLAGGTERRALARSTLALALAARLGGAGEGEGRSHSAVAATQVMPSSSSLSTSHTLMSACSTRMRSTRSRP